MLKINKGKSEVYEMENNIVSLDNFRLKKIEQKHKSTRGFHLKERKKKLYLTEKEVEILLDFLDEDIGYANEEEEMFIKQNEWKIVENCRKDRQDCERIKKIIKDNIETYEDYVMLERDDISFLDLEIHIRNSSTDKEEEERNFKKYETIMKKFDEKLIDKRPII